MRIPRKTLAASLSATLAFGVAAVAYGDGETDNVAQVTASLQPSLQDDEKAANGVLFAQVTTYDQDNTPAVPVEASKVVEIDFPAEMKYTVKQKFLDNCAPATVAAATSDEAADVCRDALIGAGSAYARIPGFPTTNNETELTVNAFNGPEGVDPTPKGKGPAIVPTITLHASNAAVGATVVEGFIVDSPNGADYGKQLNVPVVPDVAAGAGAIVLFNAQIQKRYNNGKGGNKLKRFKLIRATCDDTPGDGDWDFQSFWEYEDTSSDMDTYAQDCTEK